jgi:branched-subunit amino acid permease
VVFGAGSLYWPHQVEKNVSEHEVHEKMRGFAITAIVCGILQFVIAAWQINVKRREQGKVHTK